MNYCSRCSAPLICQIPAGDDIPRHVCTACQTIHYQNPKMVVGALATMDGGILLCRRAIEPCRDKWTLPAGYLENGETVEQCARRESMEEARAKLADLQPYVLANLPFINQVYFMFRAQLLNTDFEPGPESLETRLVSPAEIPWDDLAFAVIRRVLELYIADTRQNLFPFRVIDIHFRKRS